MEEKKKPSFWDKFNRKCDFNLSSTHYWAIHLICFTCFLMILIWTTWIYWQTDFAQYRYDNNCNFTNTRGNYCELVIYIHKKFNAGTGVYLGIYNFRQTYPKFLSSISYAQLDGAEAAGTNHTECFPNFTNEEMSAITSYNTGKLLDQRAIAVPCGLLAKYFPKDSFELVHPETGHRYEIDDTNISFPGLKGNLFKDQNKAASWLSPENEKFINWVRPSALPFFLKLWGRTKEDMEPGKYRLIIFNDFKTDQFKGQKFFVLGEQGFLGGKNYYIPVLFFICSVISAFFVITFGYVKSQEKDL